MSIEANPPGSFFRWIKSYSINRTQYIEIQGSKSLTRTITSDVSVGPILFNLFINELKNNINKSHLLLFTYDARFYLCIETNDSPMNLQDDLNSFEQWCVIKSMVINVDKCCVVRYTNKKITNHWWLITMWYTIVK